MNGSAETMGSAGPKPVWPSRPPTAAKHDAKSHGFPPQGETSQRTQKQELQAADIGKIIGASRATVYRYLTLEPG
ncbi:hypothetical protein [Arthrobacter cryoconiti]|uniref:hypothetical protein n=1 Tax=Arthrobacter cryoconiti TaxID=748907 RepID=UPI0031ED72AD